MASPSTDDEIVLYDLACLKGACFSPIVWKIRLMLNYKRIPYKTVFLEFPDIEPALKGLGIAPPESTAEGKPKYTVPAIYHAPTQRYIMDSTTISHFLEATYPSPPLQLTSPLGQEIEAKSRSVIGLAFRTSITPREVHILSPRSADYFRRTREATLSPGRRLEDLLPPPEAEDEIWEDAGTEIGVVSELMQTRRNEGPFVLGATPSYTDFFLAGALQSARMVDEGVFQRIVKYHGYKEVYEACLPWLEKND